MGNAVSVDGTLSVETGPLTSDMARALMGELLWSEIGFDPKKTRSRAELAALVAKHIATHSVNLTRDSGPDPGSAFSINKEQQKDFKKEPTAVPEVIPAEPSGPHTLALPSVGRDKALLTELFRCNNGNEWENSENWCEETALSTWAGVVTEGTAWIDGNVSEINFIGQGLTDLQGFHVLKYLESFQKLQLANNEKIQDLMPLSHTPFLQQIDLRFCSGLTSDAVAEAFASCPGITHINFSGCDGLHQTILPRLSHLKLVTLGLAWIAKDNWLPLVAETWPAIQNLDLKYCEKITTLRHLAPCTWLRSIILEECRKLKDISVLANCPDLTSVPLSGCECLSHKQIEDVLGIDGPAEQMF